MITIVLLAAGVVLPGCARQENTQAEEKAEAAAATWLELLDEKEYPETWEDAAAYFKGAVTEDKWVQTISALRDPLGRVLSRRLRSKEFTTTMPGAPDGEYVVLQYDTVFERKQSAVETVTPMKGEDGVWRVSGYFIK